MKGNPYKLGSMATKSAMKDAQKTSHIHLNRRTNEEVYHDKEGRVDAKAAIRAKKAEKKGRVTREFSKSPMEKGHEGPKEGGYTTHGNPSKYTTSSGKSVDSANIDEGNLSTVKKDSKGRKFVTVQDATEKFKAGTKLYIN